MWCSQWYGSTIQFNSEASTYINTNQLGTYTYTYTATDTQNNTNTNTRQVSIVDTTSPVITITGDTTINHEVNTTYTDQGATATIIMMNLLL